MTPCGEWVSISMKVQSKSKLRWPRRHHGSRSSGGARRCFRFDSRADLLLSPMCRFVDTLTAQTRRIVEGGFTDAILSPPLQRNDLAVRSRLGGAELSPGAH